MNHTITSHIIIGDVHGNSSWKKAVDDQGIEGNKYVFVGDYFDSFHIPVASQLANFEEICQFKRDNSDNVVLLHGNHDYLSYTIGERCSGWDVYYSPSIISCLASAEDIIQTCYMFDDYLVSHAGVSEVWMDANNISIDSMEEDINQLWLDKPYAFKFNGFNPYGDDKSQGPLWIRPASLTSSKPLGYKQIVGHTPVKKIDNIEDVWFVDTGSKYYLKIDSTGHKVCSCE